MKTEEVTGNTSLRKIIPDIFIPIVRPEMQSPDFCNCNPVFY